jgi:hypothetical protein
MIIGFGYAGSYEEQSTKLLQIHRYEMRRPCSAPPLYVLGVLKRGGEVKGRVVSNVRRKTLQPIIRATVKEGATVSSDELKSYKDLSKVGYDHGVVAHGTGEYVAGLHHVNALEGFWSQVKRGIVGTHMHVSAKVITVVGCR